MNTDFLQSHYFHLLQLLYNSQKLSEINYLEIKEKLQDSDQVILGLFKTLKWSKNEKAFLIDILPILSSLKPVKYSSLDQISYVSGNISGKRPPAVTVPFNRELSYYSTMDSLQSSLNFQNSGQSKAFNFFERTQHSNIENLEQEESESLDEDLEDLNCSFNSKESYGEENKNSLANKMQFLKNMKLSTVHFLSFDENSKESGKSSIVSFRVTSFEEIFSQKETASE